MSCWIVDLDGTLALRTTTDRGPYDWNRVGEDTPNWPVVAIVNALLAEDSTVFLVSGRKEQARRPTLIWLNAVAHIDTDNIDGLFMRPGHDDRPDAEVKQDLYENRIVPLLKAWWPTMPQLHQPDGVIDDRTEVCEMWESLGLFVLRCKDTTTKKAAGT